jgi:GNAT superfamily N-acetyltransferase
MKIICNNCYHKWEGKSGETDLFFCHKCGYDINTKKIDLDKLKNWIKNNQKIVGENIRKIIKETVENLFIKEKSEVENFRHQLAQKLGIVLELYYVNSEYGPALKLPLIKVPDKMQRQGKGTQAMKAIVNYADEKGYRIFLTPSTDWGSSKTGLLRFYKSFGFVTHSGKNRDYHFKDDMVRMPNSLPKIS